jgi:hypothetical protein
MSACRLDALRRLVDVLVLSPLAVDPGSQRRGIGTRLISAALEEANRLRVPLVFVEGASSYYGPRGFERASVAGFSPERSTSSGAVDCMHLKDILGEIEADGGDRHDAGSLQACSAPSWHRGGGGSHPPHLLAAQWTPRKRVPSVGGGRKR